LAHAIGVIPLAGVATGKFPQAENPDEPHYLQITQF
jgi:hypothetical protein